MNVFLEIPELFQYINTFNDRIDCAILMKTNKFIRQIAEINEHYLKYLAYINDPNSLIRACEKGHLSEAKKWLSYNPKFLKQKHTRLFLNQAFISTCKKNHIEVIKWLYASKRINLWAENEAFYICCISGYFAMAKYIYASGNVTIVTIHNIFNNIDQEKYSNIVNWLGENYTDALLPNYFF